MITLETPQSDTTLLGCGIRKIVTMSEDVLSENGSAPRTPARKCTVAAVVANPWLGTDADHDLSAHATRIAPVLAQLLTDRLIEQLGGSDRIEAFGKAAIVGTAGEIEHGAALIHTPYFGNLVREFLEGSAIICFVDDRAREGTPITVPLWHKEMASTRSHYQTAAVAISDAPRPGEIVIIAAASTGPRPHPRIGDRSTDRPVTSLTIKG